MQTKIKGTSSQMKTCAIYGVVFLFFIWIFWKEEIHAALNREIYYARTVNVCEGRVAQRIQDGSHCYLHIVPENTGIVFDSDDNAWIEVKKSFFDSTPPYSTVGFLCTLSDFYEENRITKRRKFIRNVYSVDEVYPTLKDAQNANPTGSETLEGTVKKRKEFPDGTKYLVLSVKDRTIRFRVSDDSFLSHPEGSSVICHTESVGDFIRILTIE